jgi:hypothetical protein
MIRPNVGSLPIVLKKALIATVATQGAQGAVSADAA